MVFLSASRSNSKNAIPIVFFFEIFADKKTDNMKSCDALTRKDDSKVARTDHLSENVSENS